MWRDPALLHSRRHLSLIVERVERLGRWLASKRVLAVTFASTLVMTVLFGVVMLVWDFELIDEMYRADVIAAHVRAMSAEQRTVHAWMTATLDVAYPLAYGAFFLGAALRFFDHRWLALPALLVVPVDLAEGVTQVLLLNGNMNVLGLKTILTPLKFAFYLPALAIALVGLICAAIRR